MEPFKTVVASVTVAPNGPYIVAGEVLLAIQVIRTDDDGESESWEQGDAVPAAPRYALCRCGHSKKKPFCDGTHSTIGFNGTETASRQPYLEQAKMFGNANLVLLDNKRLCADGRFCDAHGKVWNQADQLDDPDVRSKFIRQVENCPAGRLVYAEASRRDPHPAFRQRGCKLPSCIIPHPPAASPCGDLRPEQTEPAR